jgi:hypothetical protein
LVEALDPRDDELADEPSSLPLDDTVDCLLFLFFGSVVVAVVMSSLVGFDRRS